MTRKRIATWLVGCLGILLAGMTPLNAAEDLRINPHLNYSSEINQGPLITGSDMENGAARGLPNLIFMYAQG